MDPFLKCSYFHLENVKAPCHSRGNNIEDSLKLSPVNPQFTGGGQRYVLKGNYANVQNAYMLFLWYKTVQKHE